MLSGNHFGGAAGPAVLLDGAGAAFEANRWTENGVDVWQQRCDDAPAIAAQPGWSVCEGGRLLVDEALAFPPFNVSGVELQE
jgi:hypothetical protein